MLLFLCRIICSFDLLSLYICSQSFKTLAAKKKHLVVLFSHWLLHAYGIISISRLDKLEKDLPLLALVPGPTLFCMATAKFTEPSRILSEGGSGHWAHILNNPTFCILQRSFNQAKMTTWSTQWGWASFFILRKTSLWSKCAWVHKQLKVDSKIIESFFVCFCHSLVLSTGQMI